MYVRLLESDSRVLTLRVDRSRLILPAAKRNICEQIHHCALSIWYPRILREAMVAGFNCFSIVEHTGLWVTCWKNWADTESSYKGDASMHYDEDTHRHFIQARAPNGKNSPIWRESPSGSKCRNFNKSQDTWLELIPLPKDLSRRDILPWWLASVPPNLTMADTSFHQIPFPIDSHTLIIDLGNASKFTWKNQGSAWNVTKYKKTVGFYQEF